MYNTYGTQLIKFNKVYVLPSILFPKQQKVSAVGGGNIH